MLHAICFYMQQKMADKNVPVADIPFPLFLEALEMKGYSISQGVGKCLGHRQMVFFD